MSLLDHRKIGPLLQQQRYFDAMLQLGPLLDRFDPKNIARVNQGQTPNKTPDEAACLSAMLQCLYALDMGMVANPYAIRLAELQHKRGDTEQALKTFNEAFKQHPEGTALYLHAGDLMQKLSRFDDAIRCFDRVLSLDPWHAVALNNRANVYRQQKKQELALADYRAALAINPLYAEALNNVGNLYRDMQRISEAEKSYQLALEIKPDFVACKNNYAVLLQEASRYDESIHLLNEVLAARPDFKSAWLNLGGSLMRQSRYAEAEQCYVKALDLDADYVEARFNLGMCQLSQKKLFPGFANYEARYQRSALVAGIKPPGFPIARWQGESIAGKSLLIWPEQGLGDQIMCVAYIAAVRAAAQPSRVILVCTKALVSLFSRIPGIDQVVVRDEAMPLCDYWTGIMSLPHHLVQMQAPLPAPLAYLSADPQYLSEPVRQLLATAPRKIGLCWKGSPAFASDHLRSFALSTLTPLLAADDVRWITLLPGTRDEFLAWAAGKAVDLGHEIDAATPAFEETAAVIAELDLVITSDTSIAHLSIALGKTTWLLLYSAGEWRWDIHPMADSPQLRIFRQSREGDWASVVQAVLAQLNSREPA